MLLCVVALGALRFTLLDDGAHSLPRPSMEDMAKRFHPGEGPCLRYAAEDSVPDEALARVSDSFARLGLSSRETGDLMGAFMRWGAERESSLHASDEAEEWTEALSERGSLTVRVGLWYQKSNARRALAAATERYFAEGTAALERLSPEQREEVRALWESRPEALTISNMLKVLSLLRKEETRARLAEVARVLRERAVPGEALSPERIEALTGLGSEAFMDGWGNRFTYDTTLPNPEQALEAYSRVKGAREIPFHLQRQGKEFDVRVRIQ